MLVFDFSHGQLSKAKTSLSSELIALEFFVRILVSCYYQLRQCVCVCVNLYVQKLGEVKPCRYVLPRMVDWSKILTTSDLWVGRHAVPLTPPMQPTMLALGAINVVDQLQRGAKDLT